MFARLLYWFELSIAFVAVGYLFLAQEWGLGLKPITQLLLFNKEPGAEAVWLPLEPSISRLWDLMAAPMLAFIIILHDEKDDLLGTLGFVFFGLLAYAFIYYSPELPHGFYFLILVAGAIGLKVSALSALRIGYATLALTLAYTWLFPTYGIGLQMYGAYALLFVTFVILGQFVRLVFRKLEILSPRTT